MITQQQVQLIKRPGKTYPAVDDVFQYSEKQTNIEELKKQVKEGEMLIKVLYISCDAAMRVWISGAKTYVDPVLPGDIMTGQAVGEVVFSRSKRFNQGDILQSYMRWQNYIIIPQKGAQLIPKEYPLKQHFLGVLGISGLTAYFGFFDVGKPKKGETLVVSAAAGAVGEIVVQLGKNHGLNVIAIAGTDEKCNYIKNTLGADHVINYKTQDILKTLKQVAPQGVDIYFDNVGGKILDDVLMTINDFSRIVMCGAISQYNSGQSYGVKNYMRLILKKSTMQGFIVLDYAKRYQEAVQHLVQAIQQKKLIFREDLQKGLVNGSAGLQKLLLGKNDGKVIIDLTQNSQPKL